MKFKIGQKVRCIEPPKYNNLRKEQDRILFKGHIYTVKGYTNDRHQYVILSEPKCTHNFRIERFEAIDDGLPEELFTI